MFINRVRKEWTRYSLLCINVSTMMIMVKFPCIFCANSSAVLQVGDFPERDPFDDEFEEI